MNYINTEIRRLQNELPTNVERSFGDLFHTH